jgi:hypothetical protein
MNNGPRRSDGSGEISMKDKRKAPRRPMRYTAWIALAPGKLHGCVLADISDTGGRIDVENADAIPETFMLWLARNGSARRKCSVVWRTPRQIGVAFDHAIFDPEQAALVPAMSLSRGSPNIAPSGVTETATIDEPSKTH